ncbi:MAG: heavy metal translocating P-type ATPase [Oscillospiraceae bacterium]|nr:heavy metal translocating P-type ATPase [Oscillospiraceae bacterium]
MEAVLILNGLNCPDCAEKIRRRAQNVDGVKAAEMNFMSRELRLILESESQKENAIEEVKKIVSDIEPDVEVLLDGANPEEEFDKNSFKMEIIKLLAAFSFFLAGVLIPMPFWWEFSFLILAYFLSGWEVLVRAGKNILKGEIFDENFLMALATIGAFAIKEFPEAAAVMIFYQAGELFQDFAVNRSRKSIAKLMDIRPDSANLKTSDGIKAVSPDKVAIGDIIIVKPGEKIPLDGVVEGGNSLLDTSAMTGESVPREAKAGDEVISGCISLDGALEIRVTKPFGESAVSKILEMVQRAGEKKSRPERFITRFARVYTPIVVVAAALLAFIPPLAFGLELRDWVYRALSFLVVSCPCALVISIPLSFFGGIGGASSKGILVKGGISLEALSKCKAVAFDKTGTLTKGVFEVDGIYPKKISNEELLKFAAVAESFSNHPIALSIKKAAGIDFPDKEVSAREIAGKGVEAGFDGHRILAGNKALMLENGINPSNAEGTVVHVAIDGEYAGYISLSDTLRSDAVQAVKKLKAAGVEKVFMLTGDGTENAKKVASAVGIDTFYENLLPHEKVEKVEEILSGLKDGEKLAFAGDGINDAPVLARADIGVAMGGLGSDAAIEAADVVLMTDEPSKIADGIRISKKTIRIVKQNIVFAISIKILVLILAAFGFAPMWLAVFADVGVAFLAILNALRAIRA